MEKPINILLVEDTPSDVRLTQEALKDTDIKYELTVLYDGEAAIEYLLKCDGNRPDLILLDLNMPKKNGHEVLAEIKDKPNLVDIPVILLTVSQDEQDVLKALHLKMNYYVNKPITSEKLSVLIHAIQSLRQDSETTTLSGDDAHVRYVMAGNPHTSPEILKRLANERSKQIRRRVAENPRTPQATLMELASDPEPEVRMSVSENPNAPVSLLETLAQDSHDDVRMGLAENSKLPDSILELLAADENMFVMSAARKTLSARK